MLAVVRVIEPDDGIARGGRGDPAHALPGPAVAYKALGLGKVRSVEVLARVGVVEAVDVLEGVAVVRGRSCSSGVTRGGGGSRSRRILGLRCHGRRGRLRCLLRRTGLRACRGGRVSFCGGCLGGVGFRGALCRGGAGVYRGRLVLVGSWILGRGALFHLLRGLRVVTVLRDGLSLILGYRCLGSVPSPSESVRSHDLSLLRSHGVDLLRNGRQRHGRKRGSKDTAEECTSHLWAHQNTLPQVIDS